MPKTGSTDMPASSGGRMRLDKLLLARGLYASRSRATDAIRRGAVRVDGKMVRKPGALVAADADITLTDAAAALVSRAGLKLLAAIEAEPALKRAIAGAVCADIGASTGGFTQVLLQHGARRVYAVDVGHDQLHESLRHDPRVVMLEGVNARALGPQHVPQAPAVIVADVSFISLKKALPAVLALAAPGAWLVALVKPQFEAGPQHVGSRGIVRDDRIRRRVLADIRAWVEGCGWRVARILASPIEGADGNREFLLLARKDADQARSS